MARKGKPQDRKAPPGTAATGANGLPASPPRGAGEGRSPLVRAREALENGDARRARKLAREAAQSGPDAERAEAQSLLTRLEPDPVPLLVAAGALLLISLAAWLAILHR